jgi:coenzyme F420-reducing hydrogenase delta subunit/Pyruvate/2-oxoacid:ferredoxin oxidoreductase delta subunit
LTERTLLLGNGPVASGIAKTLSAANIPVLLATPETAVSPDIDAGPFLEVRTATLAAHCTGAVGNFQVVLKDSAGSTSVPFTHIVIAEEPQQIPLFSQYGLTPCSTVRTLSNILNGLDSPPLMGATAGKTAVFLVGLAEDSHPHLLKAAMESCLKLQSAYGMKTFIFTRNLKVGASGLESLYRQTRDAGTNYMKFTDADPSFQQKPDGTVHISWMDELTQLPFTLDADLTVVDEAITPSPYMTELSNIFCICKDPAGFFQSDNVHRLSVFTNRQGILTAGACRGAVSPADRESEIQETAVTMMSLINGTGTPTGDKAEVHPGACVRCLTCYRLCTYRAIVLNTRPVVVPDACQRCGVCAAECPANAIRIEDLQTQVVSDRIKPVSSPPADAASAPFLVAFCCIRSAGRAKELAVLAGSKLPQRLTIIEVPCAGAISVEHIMAAFRHQADGVMVFTCHEGNCHSEKGNTLAARRTAHLKTVLKQIGIDPDRLLLKTLAANMAAEFTETVNRFAQQIAEAGSPRNRK